MSYFGEKYVELPSPRRIRMPAAIAFRCSDSQLEPRFILELQEHVKHVKCYLTHGLEGLDVGIFLHKNKVLRFGQRFCPRSGAPSEETATMGQLYFYAAFFSSPTIMYFTAGVAGAFGALHHMWKAWCKKKKVWVHGLMQRVHPRLVGSSRENITEHKNTRCV